MRWSAWVGSLRLVRSLFALDAAASLVFGLILLIGAGRLAEAIGVHAAITLTLGAGFVFHAAVYAWAAQRQTLSVRVVWALGLNELLNFGVGVAVVAIEGTGLTPAGSALAVDRVRFAERVSEAVASLDGVKIRRGEVESIPTGDISIIATGPLTSQSLSESLSRFIGTAHLYFYDAISPIITSESVDMSKVFRAARYGKGGDDYINCPLDIDQYNGLVDAILAADKMPLKSFERCTYFEGCMPVEEIARRGRETLRFGPMKPVGLTDPRTGARAHAVVQLRQDDSEGRLLSMVGFQTKMTYPEQRRVFRMIPGMEAAEFVRLGSLHRNTFINSPKTLAGRGFSSIYK